MKFCILADDLTGANDSGVKLSQRGLESTVLFDIDAQHISNMESVVYNTDSRYFSKEKAFNVVYQATSIFKLSGFDVVYKKMDSTLRGNVGTELDAVYEVYQPDFIIIAPASPENDRTLENGILKYKGVQLEESDFSTGSFEKICESNLTKIMNEQSKYKTALVGYSDLRRGFLQVKSLMDGHYTDGIPYLIFDSITEDDLEKIAEYVNDSGYNTVWAGSSGLIKYLPHHLNIENNDHVHTLSENAGQTLFVIGSLNNITRSQLDHLLKQPEVKGFKLYPQNLIQSKESKEQEIARVAEEVRKSGKSHHTVIFTSDEVADTEKTKKACGIRGLDHYQAGKIISDSLGALTRKIINYNDHYNGIVLSGGDTAVEVCLHLEAKGIDLLDELSSAMPIGRINGPWKYYVITKGGGIGAPNTFIGTIDYLRGGTFNCIKASQ